MAIDTVKQDVRDECNALTRKLTQLQALLFMTYGEERESLNSVSEDLQDNFMWACHDMADECLALSLTVSTTVHRHAPNMATTA